MSPVASASAESAAVESLPTKDPYKEFNRAVKTFLREIMARLPHVPEIKVAFATYKLLKTVNRKTPRGMFERLIGPGGHQHIFDRDVAYFMRPDIDCDSALSGLREAAKREWGGLEPESQEAAWQHMHVMAVLSQRCA